tara:strand:- start:318 stop:497 length:180 start_codon:yes stop_codon:yes gene_type:complete
MLSPHLKRCIYIAPDIIIAIKNPIYPKFAIILPNFGKPCENIYAIINLINPMNIFMQII